MKLRKNNDIIILLFALSIFSLGVGWIYSKTDPNNDQKTISELKKENIQIITPEKITSKISKPQKTPTPPKEIATPGNEEKLMVEEIIEYIKELAASKDISGIITIFKEECPKDKILELLHTFIKEQKGNLTRDEQLKTILSIAHNYKDDKILQPQIFDIIAQNKEIENGSIPLLFLAVKINEQTSIPDLVEWYKKSERPDLRDLAKQTLEYAAKNDYDDAIKKLHEIGVKIDKDYATELLWMLIKSNKGSTSINFLKSLGADINSYDPQTKYTLLIQAIKNKNLDTVKALVSAGADVKKPSEDKSVGYPLQIARELNQITIELFLRSKGAKD